MIGPSRRTYKQLVDEVLSWGGMSADTNRLRTLAKYAVAESHRKRLGGTRWSFMLYPVPQTIAVVGGVQLYPLHDAFLTPLYFRSLADNRPLRAVPYSKISDYLPDESDKTGTPRHVSLFGISKVQNQPTSASLIAVAGPDSSKTVTITGETSTGIQSETVTVGNSSTLQFSTILDVTKNGDAWTGTLTLTSNAGAVTNLKLSAAQYGRQFPLLRSLVVPTAAETWEYNFFRQPKQLSADNDIPDTPEPFASIHVLDSLLKLQDHTRPTQSTINQWRSDQAELEADMLAAYQHGLAQDSEAEYVTYIERD